MTDAELHEARLLLPWFVNGTLDEAGRHTVEAGLEASATLRAERDWLVALRRDVQAETIAAPDDAGLAQLMQRIDGERPANVVSLPVAKRARWFAPVLALAASLVLGQAIVIGVLLGERDEGFRPLSGPTATAGDRIQIRFQPEATEAQIRTLLLDIDGDIVAGPGALGLYTIRVETGRSGAVLQRLTTRRDVVDSATAVPR
ncbi:MAG: hypothetical protein KIT73_01710 [Burkholderiales bacterium]|nr:hypothetical protein [Burkholderiales bacterium]